MAPEEELIKLREEFKQVQDRTRRARRGVVFGFVILVLALALSFVYPIIQHAEALRYHEEALRRRVEAANYQMEAQNQRVMADRNAMEAFRQEALAREQQAAAAKALEDCKKKR